MAGPAVSYVPEMAYFVGYTFPSLTSGEATYCQAQICTAAGDWSELLRISPVPDHWGDRSDVDRRLWRAILDHAAGQPVADEQLDEWLDQPARGLRVTAADVKRFLGRGVQGRLDV